MINEKLQNNHSILDIHILYQKIENQLELAFMLAKMMKFDLEEIVNKPLDFFIDCDLNLVSTFSKVNTFFILRKRIFFHRF